MKHAVIRLATEKPRTVYAFIVLLVVITGALMSRIQIDTDPENMLPADQTGGMFHNVIQNRPTYS